VVAAILAAAMSNLSAALNSLASTSIMDFYKPLVEKIGDTPGWLSRRFQVPRGAGVSPNFFTSEAHYLRMARAATIVWGVVLLAIGYLARKWGSVLETGLSIASVIYGALLGVFLLGVLTRRVGEKAAMAGMAAGLIAMAAVKLNTSVAWTWYVLIGTAVTFSAGCLASLFQSREGRG
jgi:SSS family solute:Na+ symporter